MLIQPVQRGEALIAEIADADPGRGLMVWWLGQSGFLLKSAQGQVLFDPYLSDSLTRKYAETDKPHVRMTELVAEPGLFRDIDLITSSHNHTDHLDAETLTALIAANPDTKLIIPEANRAFVAERIGCPAEWPLGMCDGELLRVGNFQIHAIPAAHNEITRDTQGRSEYLGYVVQCGEMAVYHSGDTLKYPGMEDLLCRFQIDLAILPINGNRPERRVAGNLFGDEAARLAHNIRAGLVIPCHYDMFEFNTESPQLFVETCRDLGQRCEVPKCGQRVTVPPSKKCVL